MRAGGDPFDGLGELIDNEGLPGFLLFMALVVLAIFAAGWFLRGVFL